MSAAAFPSDLVRWSASLRRTAPVAVSARYTVPSADTSASAEAPPSPVNAWMRALQQNREKR